MLVASAAGCGSWPGGRGRLRARVTRPPKDTVRFTAAARGSRCGAPGRGGLVIEGATGGQGVIVWLRYRDSLGPGEWPLLQRADTLSARGAVVGARFLIADLAHGVNLDSGAVRVSETGRALTIVVQGSGLEPVDGVRAGLEATFDRVSLGGDTASCRAAP